MRSITSNRTFFYKRVFPVIWCGVLLVVFVMPLTVARGARGGPSPPFFVVLLLLLGIGFFVFKKLLGGLADEVLDAGDFLLVRRDGVEEKILFGNIRNVNYQNMTNPPRVTLSLREANRLGKEISFLPPVRFTEAFRGANANEVVESLIDRMDRARG